MSANPPAEVQALQRARSQILAAERRVSAIEAPPDARKIHADLVTMLRLEASLTGDLLVTTHYVPQFKQALLPLAPAGTALARDLRTAKGWNAQANAFAVYRAKLEPVMAQLGTLVAPPVLSPTLIGEQAALRRRVDAQHSGRERAPEEGREGGQRGDPGSLFAVGSDAVRTRNAEIAAARAYNARIARISVLTAAIARERQRLLKEIG